jgi:hypothetical protein
MPDASPFSSARTWATATCVRTTNAAESEMRACASRSFGEQAADQGERRRHRGGGADALHGARGHEAE